MILQKANIQNCNIKIAENNKIAGTNAVKQKIAVKQNELLKDDKKYWLNMLNSNGNIFAQFFGPVLSEKDMKRINAQRISSKKNNQKPR